MDVLGEDGVCLRRLRRPNIDRPNMPTKQHSRGSDKPPSYEDGFSSQELPSPGPRGGMARRWAPFSALDRDSRTNLQSFLAYLGLDFFTPHLTPTEWRYNKDCDVRGIPSLRSRST